jgi:hypothetical protein
MAALPYPMACLWRNLQAVYTWLDPKKMSYNYGYSSPWTLARLIHATVGVVCHCLVFGDWKCAPGVVTVIIIFNIRKEGLPPHQVPAMGLAKHHNQICILCHTWATVMPVSISEVCKKVWELKFSKHDRDL